MRADVDEREYAERSGFVAARTVVVEREDFSLTRRSYHNISLDRNETPPVRVSLAMRGIASSKTSTGRRVSSSRAQPRRHRPSRKSSRR
jgi:hypothetical protein